MPYPIIEKPVADYIEVSIDNVDVLGYVVSINGRWGSTPDAYFCTLQPGSASFELYNVDASIDAHLVPGKAAHVRTIPNMFGNFTSIYRGIIRDVSTNYEYEPETNRLVPRTFIETVDNVAEFANKTIEANTFSKTPNVEKISVAAFGSAFLTATGYEIVGASALTTTYINQFNRQVNGVEAMELVARSINKYTYVVQHDTGLWTGDFGYASTSGPATFPFMITDGTHTGSLPAASAKMIGVNYGYNSRTALSEVDFNNTGLNRAPKAAKDSGIVDIDVTYKATQSIGFNNSLPLQTVVATDNLGWNLLNNTASESTSPQNIWPADYFNYGISPTTTLNDHPVVVATCNTAFSSRALPLMYADTQNNFVTSPPGGMTGNWIAHLKVRGTTPTTVPMYLRIVWYNSSGTVLRTDNGTSTAFTNTAWTTINITVATPPAGAVTGQLYAVVNGGAAVGYQFFMSEALFTRIGVTSTFFNGDTADTSTYLYTWTGSPGASPSQKNTNNLTALGATVLARNTVQKKVVSVTVNAFEDPAALAAFGAVLMYNSPTVGTQICVDGVTGNYIGVGYTFSISPESLIYTLDVVKI